MFTVNYAHPIRTSECLIQGMQPNPWITSVIVLVTFLGIAIGCYPIIKSNRTTIALMGVALLLVTGQVSFDKLPGYNDFNTIILLFSMMILTANLILEGFFNLADGWLALASASTLAGNLTLLGSVANLIVAETAARYRVDLSFWQYFKSGFVITLVTLAINTGWPYLIS